MGYYRRDRRDRRTEQEDTKFKSEVLYINRVAKVLKGGRRFRFTALVAVGDGEGQVGLGLGKAPEVVEAIHKGEELARKNMVDICRAGTTIPFGIKQEYCSTTVLLRPAREGAGITAGGPARSILALAGLTDCTAKFFGSNNRVNCARATFEALKNIESPKETLKHRRDRNYRIESRREVRKPEEEEAEAREDTKTPVRTARAGAPAGAPVTAKTAKATEQGAKEPARSSAKKTAPATRGDKPTEGDEPEAEKPEEIRPDTNSGEVQE